MSYFKYGMPIQKHTKRVSLCNTGLQQYVTYQYCVSFVYITLQQPSCDTKQHCLVKHSIRKQYEESVLCRHILLNITATVSALSTYGVCLMVNIRITSRFSIRVFYLSVMLNGNTYLNAYTIIKH